MEGTEVKPQLEDAPRFHIEPAMLYSRLALERALAGMMDVETFLLRTQPKKRFKSAWWGGDLIEAVNAAPALGEGAPAVIVPITEPTGKARRVASAIPGCPIGLEPLDPKKIN